jgi:hypothetical protein
MLWKGLRLNATVLKDKVIGGSGVGSSHSGSRISKPEHSSATATLSSSLPVYVAFTFARNRLLLYMPEQKYSANDRRKDFMINHNESEMYRPGIEPESPESQCNVLTGR